MPRKWHTHWPVQAERGEDRDRIIHTLGNLTLLTGKLNSKVSNGAWWGAGGKREALETHDVLFLNRELVKETNREFSKDARKEWTDDAIRIRTRELARVVAQIWPVPPNHRPEFSRDRPRPHKKVDLSDLIAGGALEPGMSLFP